MSWRNKGSITGANNIPVGPRRRGGEDDYTQKIQQDDPVAPHSDYVNNTPAGPLKMEDRIGSRSRKRKTRWGPEASYKENKILGLMGIPAALTALMTPEQVEAYALALRIEEITQKMKINDVVPPHRERSKSPPPTYDSMGRRTNTREVRYRKKLEDERHRLVEKAMKFIPEFKPPSDYRRLTRTQEKIYIPVNDYPEINFSKFPPRLTPSFSKIHTNLFFFYLVGLLIGPRGNTLKQMEAESGAKIAIRGKGSVKEGKGRSDAAAMSNLEEDLHCLVTADSEEKVAAAIAAIERIIETAASTPEAQNELKKNQLRMLATLNGTLRDDENQACQNCNLPSLPLLLLPLHQHI
jgi:splicing factor 1